MCQNDVAIHLNDVIRIVHFALNIEAVQPVVNHLCTLYLYSFLVVV